MLDNLQAFTQWADNIHPTWEQTHIITDNSIINSLLLLKNQSIHSKIRNDSKKGISDC